MAFIVVVLNLFVNIYYICADFCSISYPASVIRSGQSYDMDSLSVFVVNLKYYDDFCFLNVLQNQRTSADLFGSFNDTHFHSVCVANNFWKKHTKLGIYSIKFPPMFSF